MTARDVPTVDDEIGTVRIMSAAANRISHLEPHPDSIVEELRTAGDVLARWYGTPAGPPGSQGSTGAIRSAVLHDPDPLARREVACSLSTTTPTMAL